MLAGRLIPWDKGAEELRQISIGEVLRRIVSKAVSTVLKNKIQNAVGSIQTCSGVKAGIEAAVHAMRKIFLIVIDTFLSTLQCNLLFKHIYNFCNEAF
jgi:hypothetical protein